MITPSMSSGVYVEPPPITVNFTYIDPANARVETFVENIRSQAALVAILSAPIRIPVSPRVETSMRGGKGRTLETKVCI